MWAALVLRVTIWIPAGVSATWMVCSKGDEISPTCKKTLDGIAPWSWPIQSICGNGGYGGCPTETIVLSAPISSPNARITFDSRAPWRR